MAVYVVIAVVAVWIVINSAMKASGHEPFDPFPYPSLQGLATLGALLMTILILTTETRLGDISERRARLTLQIGILTEQKVATIIKLLEQLRRDDPNLRERHDDDVRAMTEASDPAALLKALDDVHEAVISEE
ncbi:MAG: DUF1003 domain-containing protein [Candidatus Eremiobacteraeota bacterium]|nr:DUF1003 domain-containing protein [Candidatus Eremiobacteraeota bacterium]